MRNLFPGVSRRIALVGGIAALVTGLFVAVGAPQATAAQNFDNARVADFGLAEVGTSRATGWNQPGECIKSAQRWVANAGGRFGGGGTISGYVNSGATEVPLGQAVKGDVIQYSNANNNDWTYAHTVVVVKNLGNGRFDIVQSNVPLGSGLVSRNTNWVPSPHAGWTARAWRFGQVVSNPAQPYAGQIVQWNGDPKTQKTSWYVTSDLRRLWIPDAATYYCLKGRGVAGPTALPPSVLDRMPDQTNSWVPCGDRMGMNRVLRRNMYLQSGDGRYRLWLQGDGNFVLYGPSGRALWANNRFNTDFVVMQGDGNLVGYTNAGQATWATGTNGRADTLVVQSDGNLVLYGRYGAAWATGTNGRT